MPCWRATKTRDWEAAQRELADAHDRIACLENDLRAEKALAKYWQGKHKACQDELERQRSRDSDFRAVLVKLRQLCHPDRHGGSRLSNDVTAWLNVQAKELRA